MAAKPKDDYDHSAKIKIRPRVFKRVVEACAEPRKANAELKALYTRGKLMLNN